MVAAATWAEREASRNPVFPFEWTLVYENGGRFPRVLDGRVRTTADAPCDGIVALEVSGPRVDVAILPSGQIDEVVVRARVIRLLADVRRGAVGAWCFGFTGHGLFNGITIDAAGRVRTWDVPTPFRTAWKGQG